MPIQVTCPGCLKRFQVNEKFAGKSGPCPNCKHTLKIPTKSEEVIVHAPQEFESGGRDTSGKLTLKPIAREETKITPLAIACIAGAVVLAIVGALIGNSAGLFKEGMAGTIACAIGLLIISPPAALGGYGFLRNDELEPHRGVSLYVRSLICGATYVILWGVFMYAYPKVFAAFGPEIWTWIGLAAIFLAGGSAAAWATFDLEPGNAFTHYAFYLLATILLRWVAGLGWIWKLTVGS
jgi:hypothetical protein